MFIAGGFKNIKIYTSVISQYQETKPCTEKNYYFNPNTKKKIMDREESYYNLNQAPVGATISC